MRVHAQYTMGYGDYSYTYNFGSKSGVNFKSIYNPNSMLHKVNPVLRFLDNYYQRSLSASRYAWSKPHKSIAPYLNAVKVGEEGVSDILMWDFNKENRSKYIIILHGLSHNISSLQDLYEQVLNKTNFAVLAPEYHGLTKGNKENVYPSPKALLRDIKNSVKYLEDKGIPHKNIYILGHSFGGFVGTKTAKEFPDLGGLILVSSTTSNNDWTKKIKENRIRHTPKIIKDILTKSKFVKNVLKLFFNTERVLRKVKVPVDIIHAKNDKLIDLKTTEKLASKCKNLKSFSIVDGNHRMDDNKINKIVEILNYKSSMDVLA